MDDRKQRFSTLYDAFAHRVYGYALRRLNRSDAEDVVAETFTIVWRRLEDIPEEPLGWLLATARRVCANKRRAIMRRDRLEHRARLVAPPPSVDPQSNKGRSSEVMEGLKRLPKKHREALFLAFWEDLDHRTAGAVLGCSSAAFALRLHRARAALRKELGSAGHDYSDAEYELRLNCEERQV